MHEPFGRYGLLRRLAVGGMAEIYLAALHGDAGFEKKVVLKRILPHLGRDIDFVRMFIDEAMMASKLSHPNIIEVYDFGHAAGSYFMAMEYVDGIDLNRVLQRVKALGQPLNLAEVTAIGERVARGLAYTHNLTGEGGLSQAVVHRDVSPHNIMISRLGAIKVMDFGIAKAAARASQTATGTLKGKIAYMSPEQARGERATKYSDQFALGIILWECLAGRRLFEGDSDVTLLRRVSDCHIPNIADITPTVPQALVAIVQKALHCSPQDRYGDLNELADALVAVRYSLGEAGIVKLETLVSRYAGDDAGDAEWSWAQEQSQSPPAGTRLLPGVIRAPAQVVLKDRTKTRKVPRGMPPHRAVHASQRRPILRGRLSVASSPLRAARNERLPWLLVGALLATLVTVVSRAAWSVRVLQAMVALALRVVPPWWHAA